MNRLRRHLMAAGLAGLTLRLFLIWYFPADAGDSAIYEELARNWLHHHVYGLVIAGQVAPVDIRMPGYPAFLAVLYLIFGRGRGVVLLAQALIDVATCLLAAVLAAQLAPARTRERVAIAAVWLAATCPFVANYSAVPLTEVLATFLTAGALIFLTAGFTGRWPFRFSSVAGFSQARAWFLAGLLTGLGTLVRPEAPLLLAAAGLVAAAQWRHPRDWARLARVTALLTAGFLIPLLPWAARNWITLHRVQLLAPRYAESPGEYVPRGFFAWTQTWLVRYRDVYLAPWKLGSEPIDIADLPSNAFDSSQERARVAELLGEYNVAGEMTPELDREFGALARERERRHPWRTHLWIPLDRAATLWFTPRVDLLPFSGHLWPIQRQWEEDPVDFSVTVFFGLLNFLYAGLALGGVALAIRWQDSADVVPRAALALLIVFLLLRTAFLTQIETPEPRYVLECFPSLLALGAMLFAGLRQDAAAS